MNRRCRIPLAGPGWLPALCVLALLSPARGDEVYSGQVKAVDLATKKLTVTEDRTNHEMVIAVGDHTSLLVNGRKVALSRIRPGASVRIWDTILASKIQTDNEVLGTIAAKTPSTLVLNEEGTGRRVEITLSPGTTLEAGPGTSVRKIGDLTVGSRVLVIQDGSAVAGKIVVEHEAAGIVHELWENFRHNLFKPLLLFFYLGFLVPLLRVKFEFPYVMYQALTIYLLIAIGWHGGEELSALKVSELSSAVGFMAVGFGLNFVIGILSYIGLSALTRLRRVDKATVAGYYGSDSAGTFVTCLGVLASAGIAYQAYMPVMLAVMEIPGCLVALFLVSRLRHSGMDALGNMPDESGYNPAARPLATAAAGDHGHGHGGAEHGGGERRAPGGILSPQLLHEVFLNPGLYLLFGGIAVGYISGLQGPEVTRADDNFFVVLFQGVLCLFLLEMGMTAARKLRDLRTAGGGFVAFGLLAPNLFATLGILVAHLYSHLTGARFDLGTYVLFSVLCAAASYIAVPAVQRLAIPEASPTLPLAASLGLTFSYNVTVGIPVYIEVAKAVLRYWPVH